MPSLFHGSDVTPEHPSLCDVWPFPSIQSYCQTKQALPSELAFLKSERAAMTKHKLLDRDTVTIHEVFDDRSEQEFLKSERAAVTEYKLLDRGTVTKHEVLDDCSEQEFLKVPDCDSQTDGQECNYVKKSSEPFYPVYPCESATAEQYSISQESKHECGQKGLLCPGPTHSEDVEVLASGSVAVRSEQLTRANEIGGYKAKNDGKPVIPSLYCPLAKPPFKRSLSCPPGQEWAKLRQCNHPRPLSPPAVPSKSPQDPPDLSPNYRPLEELLPWKGLS